LIHDYGDDIVAIDTFMHGWEGITAVYFLPGDEPALIESGPGSSIEKTLEGLEEAGVDDLAWIVLTHIHLDHAGAAGYLTDRYPSAKVVVRQEGAKHLVDPSRLWASASRIYMGMEKLWGKMEPVPADRIVAISGDTETVPLGKARSLRAIHSPGHARHHMALLDEGSGSLFTGDAIGVYLPEAGVIRPATPPPEFHLEESLETIAKLKALEPKRVFPTHFGPVPDPQAALDEGARRLTDWVGVTQELHERGASQAEIAQAFRDKRDLWYPGLTPDLLEKFEQTTSYEMNAAGMLRYVTKKLEAEQASTES